MSKRIFKSVHAETFSIFIGIRRAKGYGYESQCALLHRFDSFLCTRSYGCLWLTREIVDEYRQEFRHCKAFSQAQMLSVIRVYSRFLRLRYPQSYVLEMPTTKAKRPSRFYIYSLDEVAALLKAASESGPIGSIRPLTVKTLLALLYISGLRISEALALNVDDLDIKERTLFVRKGKFGKDRYVPLAASSVDALLRYRQKASSLSSDNAFFISTRGTRLNKQTMGNIFRGLLRTSGIASCRPWPRLHDLRHTFAVNCLCKWNDQGLDVNALLPVLSTVMGHVNVSCTQVYLHVPAKLLEQASNRFHHHFKNTIISGE